MANKKYTLTDSNYWETSGVYDITEGKTQREINAAKVPNTRTVNGKALSADITLSSEDIGDDSGAGGANVKASLAALKGSLNDITPFDTTPTSGSVKGVTSGGVRSAIDNLSSLITITPLKTFNNVVAGARKNNRIVSIDVSFQNPADGSVIGNNNVQLFSGFPIPVVNAQGWRGATLFGFIIDAPQDATRTGKPVRFLVNENGVLQTYWGTSIQLQESVSISAMYFS